MAPTPAQGEASRSFLGQSLGAGLRELKDVSHVPWGTQVQGVNVRDQEARGVGSCVGGLRKRGAGTFGEVRQGPGKGVRVEVQSEVSDRELEIINPSGV